MAITRACQARDGGSIPLIRSKCLTYFFSHDKMEQPPLEMGSFLFNKIIHFMTKQSNSSEDGSLNIAFFSVLTVCLLLLFIFSEGEALPKEGEKEISILSSVEEILLEEIQKEDLALYNDTSLLAQSSPNYHKPKVLAVKEEKKEEKTYEKRWVRLSAYAPLDPLAQEGMCFSGDRMTTAWGTLSREGVVASNFLPFGTKIRIPSLFGDRIFTVEDRMSSRYNNTIDVLVSTRSEAISFGVKNAYIEIIK